MNRMGLGLAIGAGYLLGRTRKLKMAVAVGGLVAGKKLNLGPRMVADLVSQQLRDNPQFKELGDQLRGDLRGVGKAASGALVERQLDSFADRLHGRTAEMRDRLTGAGPKDRAEADTEDAEDDEEPEDLEEEEGREPPAEQDEEKGPAPERAAKKSPAKATAQTAAKQAPAKKAAAKKTAAKKSAAKTSAAAPRDTRSRTSKGGGER
ncbi:DNA primase [Streptomyces griseoloalbus]|uniref:DNA primase n=1 Tax=Streptomyces griseoloalbus TaxID=67303 RepID=A0ABV3E1T7_9ACTN